MTGQAIEHNPVVYELFSDANAFPFVSSQQGKHAWRVARGSAISSTIWDVQELRFYADSNCVFEIRGIVTPCA